MKWPNWYRAGHEFHLTDRWSLFVVVDLRMWVFGIDFHNMTAHVGPIWFALEKRSLKLVIYHCEQITDENGELIRAARNL